jgi:hypothetical protein
MWKKIITMLIIILLVSACSADVSENENVSENIEEMQEDAILNEDYEGALPVELQLTIGTMMLEDTEFAPDSGLAAELLPLWKAFRSLSESDTTAEGEIDAISNQIQEAMHDDQLTAIAGMQLTGVDMFEIANELGLEMPRGMAGFNPKDMDEDQRATLDAMRESGQGPGGNLPGGGRPEGGVPGQGLPGQGGNPDVSEDQIATKRAERGGAQGLGFMRVFIDSLIELMESKV